jgi:hypothetical protein
MSVEPSGTRAWSFAIAASMSGPAGATKLDGNSLGYDFTRGATSIGLVPTDHVLLGTPTEFRIRIRGKAAGHPLRLRLATHFMTFEKTIATLSGDGEQEIVTAAPPGEGWRWFGGENDGKLHGPIRITGIYLDRGENADSGRIELLDIRVKATCPANKACVFLAELRDGPGGKRFVATARSMLAGQIDGTVSWTIRDWPGTTISEAKQRVKIPGGCAPVETSIAVPAGKYAFLEAEATLEAADQIVPAVQAYYVAPIPPRDNAGMDPASPFGMGLYLGRYPAGELMDLAASKARDVGVRWSREGFSGPRIEPKKGQYYWTYHDQLVATARRNGISIYGLISGWAPYTKPYSEEGIEDYCRFAAAAAEHYRKDIRHWEVWNEPNIFFWQGPREMYAELLKRAYAAIKKGNPDAQVLGCSTAGIDSNFIRKTMDLGAPFDILTIHPYRTKLDDRAFINDLKKVAELVRRPDGKLREVWITEMGWATHVPHNTMRQDFQPNTQRQQAQYIARSYIDALASGAAPNISWYDFRNDGTDQIYFEHNMGIMTRDFAPKPAYRAFATMTRVLNGYRVDREIDLGAGVIACRFANKSGGAITAMWSTDGDRTVAIPANKAIRIIDLMGDEKTVDPADGKAQVGLKAFQAVFVSE